MRGVQVGGVRVDDAKDVATFFGHDRLLRHRYAVHAGAVFSDGSEGVPLAVALFVRVREHL